jgi:ERCC4-type nuclease
VVERKAIDDLASSIIDGRYREQKHRLLSTNLVCIYLIEGPIEESRLSNAAISTGLSGFTVIRSESIK